MRSRTGSFVIICPKQAMPSFHLSSAHSKAAVRVYIERKMLHAKSTLEEHLHMKFVVGKRYLCELPAPDSMDDSMGSPALRLQECVLVQHLDAEYEVELVTLSETPLRVRVKTLREIAVEPVDDCDWSDEAYARDSHLVLAAIAADVPGFQMLHCRPAAKHRTHWPIKFYYPSTLKVRSQMDFDEVDFGIHFSPFLSEAILPSLAGDSREQLMKTVSSWRAVFRCRSMLLALTRFFCRHWQARRIAASGCTWVSCSTCIPWPCKRAVATAAPSCPKKLRTLMPPMVLKTASFSLSRFAACCGEEAR